MECPSGTPLVRKLGIKTDSQVGLVDAPAGFPGLLVPLPPGVVLRHLEPAALAGEFDVLVAFQTTRAPLESRLHSLIEHLAVAGGLWLCWPKKSSGVSTDLGDAVVRACGLETGLVDNKVCSIDPTWSALRFVRRLSARGARR